MQIILLIVIAVLMVGLFIGVPYWQAFKRRKELERRGRLKPPKRENDPPP